MIKVAIVDDEVNSCKTLLALLKNNYPQVEVAGIYNSGIDFLKGLETIAPQIVFLDIEMPHMNGFELLEKLPSINFELIFTTGYDQYAIKAIRFSALDYLLKPIDREELQKAVHKAIQRLSAPQPQQIDILLKKLQQPAASINKIALPTMEGLQMVTVDSIVSCASDGNYTNFFLKNNKKIVASRLLKEIEEMLEGYPFIRVHNCYIVNINEIEKYVRGEGGYLIMSNGSSVDVSRSRKEMLLKKLFPGKL